MEDAGVFEQRGLFGVGSANLPKKKAMRSHAI
jgi:hypothetical protein